MWCCLWLSMGEEKSIKDDFDISIDLIKDLLNFCYFCRNHFTYEKSMIY
jgi:hypothetical protein